MIATNFVLSAYLFFNSYIAITIPPTDPTHVYILETSTNLPAFDNTDAIYFFGVDSEQMALAGPELRDHEYFRVEDLGPITSVIPLFDL